MPRSLSPSPLRPGNGPPRRRRPFAPGSAVSSSRRAEVAFTLRQLQYFIAVAEEGTVSGAAQSLSISQSAVADAIKELESDLGVTLFERHRRGLTITHKGHQFYRHAQRILGDVQDARRSFATDEPAAPPSQLSLGVTSLKTDNKQSDLLARFRRAYPGVKVS